MVDPKVYAGLYFARGTRRLAGGGDRPVDKRDRFGVIIWRDHLLER